MEHQIKEKKSSLLRKQSLQFSSEIISLFQQTYKTIYQSHQLQILGQSILVEDFKFTQKEEASEITLQVLKENQFRFFFFRSRIFTTLFYLFQQTFAKGKNQSRTLSKFDENFSI